MTNSKSDGNSTDPDDGDWLGYGAYADALWGRIQAALIKSEGANAKLGDDPLVIGVFGEWGAGKSKLLSLMQDRSRAWANKRIGWRKRDGGNFGLTVPVYFQPWKYEHEAHLHVPILLHILAALKHELTEAQTWGEWAGGKVPDAITKHMDAVVGAFGLCLAGAAVALDLTLPLTSRVGLAAASFLGKGLQKVSANRPKSNPAETLQYTDSGRYFYEIHETLKAITRPKQHPNYLQGVNLNADLPINFVIFIDDLDRCLPEKAVQTLELIKTVFNAESFAFVLALDEEVIERGIGHRYQAYNFAGKKPEMPITGFEYLEKIVHLPFKLPAVTASQARHFVEKLEEQIAPEGPFWFKPMKDVEASNPLRQSSLRGSLKPFDKFQFDPSWNALEESAEKILEFDLLSLALRGFDAYVPRKLARLVELWHTTVQVAILRNQADDKKEVLKFSTAAQVDIRIVITLLMVQIFHPDLYRVFRRHEETFQTLYNGFDGSGDNLSPSLSDIDLWHWAAYKHKDFENLRPMHLEAALAMIAKLDDGSRYPAQQKRLPLVECIVAHRKAQRHVFDALKLFSALKQQMPELPQGFKVAQYFSLLAEYDPTLTPPPVEEVLPATAAHDSVVDASDRFIPVDAQQLYLSLIANDLGTQEALVEKAQLESGKFLAKEALDQLFERVKKWLEEVEVNSNERRQRQVQLLNGLGYLTPFISSGEGAELWKLVENSVDLAEETRPKLRALWGDVRAKLGCDPRFETTGLCFAKKDIEDPATGFSTKGDAVPGFVLIDAVNKAFWFGDGGEDSGKPLLVQGLDKSFFLARTLTTVSQYAQFVNAKDYASYFVGEGKYWLYGSYESKVSEESLKKSMDRRPTGQRYAPYEWPVQLANPLRPVVHVSWFEAQAYVQWLNASLPQYGLASFQASLPTELQWECAARFTVDDMPLQHAFPWSHRPSGVSADKEALAQHANFGGLVGNPITVGLYPKGRSGAALDDLAGNVWEWMAGSYLDGFLLNTALAPQNSLNVRALRGGSWLDEPSEARCSCRFGSPPDYWSLRFGFRVVLSQAN